MERSYNHYTKQFSFDKTGPKKWQRELTPNSNDILLVNYESLYSRKEEDKGCLKANIEDFIHSCKNQKICVILDESHKIKDLETRQTKAIQKIMRNLALYSNDVYLYLLTGTPFTQGFIDLYSQLKLLGWQGNKNLFVDSFCIRGNIPGLLGWQQPIVGYRNVENLYKLVHEFGITIKSNDVIQLPEQIFQYHVLPQSKDMVLYTAEKLKPEYIQKELDARNSDFELEESIGGGKVNNPFYRNIAFPDLKWLAETIGTFWMRARQISIGFQGNAEEAKWFNKNRIEKLKKLLEDNPDNYVLFYNFTPELLEIYEVCEQLGYNIDVYCGEMKSEYFYNRYTNQSEGERLINKKNIILANFASGSTGANWQMYNKCILFSVPLFKDYEQGIKRVHRIGQKETVIYHIFYEDNWLDKSMIESLNQSKDYNNDLFEADLKRVQSLF